MRYGHEYAKIIEDSGFPLEWRESAIEYKQLKKLIKKVSNELSALGLNPTVLNRLLHPSNEGGEASDHVHPSESPAESSRSNASGSVSDGERDLLELEFSSDDSEEDADVDEQRSGGRGRKASRTWTDETGKRFRVRVKDETTSSNASADSPEGSAKGKERARRREHEHETFAVKGGFMAEYELGGTSDNPHPRLRLVPLPTGANLHRRSSLTPSTASSDDSPSRSSSPSRSAMPAPPGPSPLLQLPLSLADDDSTSDGQTSEADLDAEADDQPSSEPLMASTPRYFFGSVKSPMWALQSGAEEGLAGLKRQDTNESSETIQASIEKKIDIADALADEDEDEDEEDDGEDLTVPEGFTSVIGTTPSLSIPVVAVQPATPEGLLKTGGPGRAIAEADLFDLDGPAVIDVEVDGVISSSPPPPAKELFIELASDVEFFNVLTHALSTLDTLQRTQQALFRKTVDHLCRTISSAARPPSTTSSALGVKLKRGDGYSDLYAWREVFTLWIEAEIFESGAERTRGERSVQEAERRLKAFAGEVTRRGLGDRRTFRSRESRAALSTFLQLNLTLLDLKKFQTANIIAARKILKKHDKRTALNASTRFPSFVVSSLAGDSTNIKTWTLFDESLPHVLTALLTEVLLPIVPSLADYECAICTSIAFKPIRLDCGHLFCVRCLAKMQRAGKSECPLCRAPVLATADGRNLDKTAMEFMKMYFPREVKVKQKENEIEVAKEDVQDMGMQGNCAIC